MPIKGQSTHANKKTTPNTPKDTLNPDNSGGPQAKLILTGGKVFDLMEEWAIPLYYDQEGKLTKKLGIKAVPATVKQKGKVLEIEEVLILKDTETALRKPFPERAQISPLNAPKSPPNSLANREGT